MSLENIYYITQIIAVIAVLGSLIFVGYQIRQNTEQTRIQNAAHLQDRYDELWRMLGGDAELAFAYKQIHNGQEVKPAQAAQLTVFAAMMANVAMTAYIAERQGIGSSKLAQESELFYLNLIRVPLFRAVQEELNASFDKFHKNDTQIFYREWSEHIEARIKEVMSEQDKHKASKAEHADQYDGEPRNHA